MFNNWHNKFTAESGHRVPPLIYMLNKVKSLFYLNVFSKKYLFLVTLQPDVLHIMYLNICIKKTPSIIFVTFICVYVRHHIVKSNIIPNIFY